MSSNKYIPPSKRALQNKFEILNEPEEEPEKKLEDEFPSLVSTNVLKTKKWEGTKKFSDLAVQCEIRNKEQQYHQEIEKSMQKYNYNNYLPKFENVGRFIEPEDDYEQENKENYIREDDGWTTVKNVKARKVKNIEEIAERPPTPEEKSDWVNDLPDDSDWNEN